MGSYLLTFSHSSGMTMWTLKLMLLKYYIIKGHLCISVYINVKFEKIHVILLCAVRGGWSQSLTEICRKAHEVGDLSGCEVSQL